jgi:hypothetical protein
VLFCSGLVPKILDVLTERASTGLYCRPTAAAKIFRHDTTTTRCQHDVACSCRSDSAWCEMLSVVLGPSRCPGMCQGHWLAGYMQLAKVLDVCCAEVYMPDQRWVAMLRQPLWMMLQGVPPHVSTATQVGNLQLCLTPSHQPWPDHWDQDSGALATSTPV